jgi:NodT family efflux transporter outer membrane factor (OMF) lipoprotein
VALTGMLLGLTACLVGPKYTKPPAPVPAAYKEIAPTPEMKEWKTAQPQDQILRDKWWEIFNDAGLNALEQRVDVSNQNLKVAEAQFRQARALVRFYRAGYYPSLTTAPYMTGNRSSANATLYNSLEGEDYGDFLLPFDLSYEADVWGRIRRSVEAARAGAQASAGDLETVKLSIHAELAVDYFELRGLDAQKQLLDSTVVAYQKALELTTNRYKGGLAAQAEVAQAETQLEATQAQAIDVGVQRAQYEHAIALLVGQPASTFSLAVLPLRPPPPKIPVGLPSELLQRRPDIASAERRVAAANAQIGVARSAFFPTILLSASGGFEGSEFANWLLWPSRLWSVGPSLFQIIYEGGARRAVSQQAQASYDATVASYRENVLAAFQQVEDNLSALRILDEESKKQDQAVEAAERSLALSTNRYKGGLVTYLEVVTAQSAALTNERTAVDILTRRMNASVLLIKALGGGWNVSNLPQVSGHDDLHAKRPAGS